MGALLRVDSRIQTWTAMHSFDSVDWCTYSQRKISRWNGYPMVAIPWWPSLGPPLGSPICLTPRSRSCASKIHLCMSASNRFCKAWLTKYGSTIHWMTSTVGITTSREFSEVDNCWTSGNHGLSHDSPPVNKDSDDQQTIRFAKRKEIIQVRFTGANDLGSHVDGTKV